MLMTAVGHRSRVTLGRPHERRSNDAEDLRVEQPESRIGNTWSSEALERLRVEELGNAKTRLVSFPLPSHWGIDLYLKDESTQPTGSLKHHLARAQFRYSLARGEIDQATHLVDVSSGSTAISEAYFARLLGLVFTAVMPVSTSPAKIDLVRSYGGECELVRDAERAYQVGAELAKLPGWVYLDQFTRAASVLNNAQSSIADDLFSQLSGERSPTPNWVVVGAGTGGTSAVIGQYLRAHKSRTRLAVVDPEGSVFYEAWRTRRRDLLGPGSLIEGIGRPRVEPSFRPEVIDEMLRVPNAASVAAAQFLRDVTGIAAGGSTGTNIYGALRLTARMRRKGEPGSVATLICDRGDRYLDSIYDPAWARRHELDVRAFRKELDSFVIG